MTFTPIPAGTTQWDVPVNAAFTDQDDRITVLEDALTVAVKTLDESVTASTTYQNDDELFVPVVSGATYLVDGYFVYNTSSAAGINLRLTGPTGVGNWTFIGLSNVGGSSDTGDMRMSVSSNGVGSARLGGAAANLGATVRGIFFPTAAGNLRFEWAQNVSDAAATFVRANSWLSVRRIA